VVRGTHFFPGDTWLKHGGRVCREECSDFWLEREEKDVVKSERKDGRMESPHWPGNKVKEGKKG
jgi:hypothetical protein